MPKANELNLITQIKTSDLPKAYLAAMIFPYGTYAMLLDCASEYLRLSAPVYSSAISTGTVLLMVPFVADVWFSTRAKKLGPGLRRRIALWFVNTWRAPLCNEILENGNPEYDRATKMLDTSAFSLIVAGLVASCIIGTIPITTGLIGNPDGFALTCAFMSGVATLLASFNLFSIRASIIESTLASEAMTDGEYEDRQGAMGASAPVDREAVERATLKSMSGVAGRNIQSIVGDNNTQSGGDVAGHPRYDRSTFGQYDDVQLIVEKSVPDVVVVELPEEAVEDEGAVVDVLGAPEPGHPSPNSSGGAMLPLDTDLHSEEPVLKPGGESDMDGDMVERELN